MNFRGMHVCQFLNETAIIHLRLLKDFEVLRRSIPVTGPKERNVALFPTFIDQSLPGITGHIFQMKLKLITN